MKFYLVCAAVFALMVVVLRSCAGEEYMSVAQASFRHGKGGEAQRKRLHHHHRYYGWVNPRRSLRWNALSAAVPSPQRDTAGTQLIMERDSRFDAAAQEPGRTPQQIIDDAFLNIGWMRWEFPHE